MKLSVCLALLPSISWAFITYTPLPPSDDAFYQPPLGYQAQQPGTILRNRTIANPSVNASIAASYQFLYRSTDSQGRPNAVVTSLFVPSNSTNTKLFTLQLAYDSAAINCAPSFQLYQQNSGIVEKIVIENALKAGWYVSVPDYEGFSAAFTNGIQSGNAVLDSLRAVLASGPISNISSNANRVLAGASGGALAAEWALELQPTYAPELRIDGSLLTALTPNITGVYTSVNGGASSSLVQQALLGLGKQFPNMSDWLADNLQSSTASAFLLANSLCSQSYMNLYSTQEVGSTYFNRRDAIFDEIPQSIINSVGVMGLHGVPQSPIYSYKGVLDQVSNIAETDALMNKFRRQNVTVEYYRATNVGHAISAAYGFVVGWPWLEARLDGTPVTPGYSVQNTTVPVALLAALATGQL